MVFTCGTASRFSRFICLNLLCANDQMEQWRLKEPKHAWLQVHSLGHRFILNINFLLNLNYIFYLSHSFLKIKNNK